MSDASYLINYLSNRETFRTQPCFIETLGLLNVNYGDRATTSCANTQTADTHTHTLVFIQRRARASLYEPVARRSARAHSYCEECAVRARLRCSPTAQKATMSISRPHWCQETTPLPLICASQAPFRHPVKIKCACAFACRGFRAGLMRARSIRTFSALVLMDFRPSA